VDKLNSKVKMLIVIAILANSIGMFYPLLISTFSPYYGSIAKHIALSNNWTDLVLSGHDWMDKPHLPFWLTAISFKIFGINSFAYIIPGFLFHILGVFYTYRLARLWYSKEVGLLAALFTATSLHLMLSSIDVRAEAYLLGEIMPACYYWLRYDRESKIKYLFLGALFTALALMTKGVFVLVTIISGLAMLWIYKRQWRNFISPKWIIALLLSFILIAPELISLYQQFDAHPDKLVFGNQHISGIKWFFWDSQFGRFFNTGPIISANPPPFHELFFVHTFLWAYLPWWPIFFASIGALVRRHRSSYKEANVYFFSSFFITFILFSITKFQVDHYTNIIFPFASIICAAYIVPILKEHKTKPLIYYIELAISVLLLLLVIIAGFIALKGIDLFIIEALALIVAIIMLKMIRIDWAYKTIIYPSIVMCMVFIFAMTVNGIEYAKYDAGYQMALYLNNTRTNVVGYKIDLISLDLHSNNNYQLIDNQEDLDKLNKPSYIVVEPNNINELRSKFPELIIVKDFVGCSFETYLANIIHPELLNQKLKKYVVLQING
jgi:4-amino-4-deoxy-L-arabinose transferase-like glycosyltransferase